MLTPTIFKANDIRGLAGGNDAEWDAAGAEALGAAFVDAFGLEGDAFVLGRDMRRTGVELSRAFAAGATARGADVVDIGLASTDEVWFASGHLHLPGVQFTASHNPAAYNGVKFCRPDAAPITPELLTEIMTRAQHGYTPLERRGSVTERDLLPAYAEKLLSLVERPRGRRLKVVVDAGNGMAGHTCHAVLGQLDVEVVGLYLDLDGSFPHHQPNPLEPQNLVDARRAVIDNAADVALVFDGDADRCFIIDERGEVVSPSIVTALIAERELRREPGATIVVNTITSRIVREVVEAAGGRVVTSRVGHTYVKALMAQHDAIFGGEHSAHYYFRDFWFADTGMLAALHVLATLGGTDQPLSALTRGYERYVGSGEINSTVTDAPAAMARVERALGGRGSVDHTDGLMINGPDWWVSVRASNTEPLLRLNVEARDEATMAELRDAALAEIRREA